MFIIKKQLTESEYAPIDLRWNEDCNCVQQTPDGGDTWVDQPGQDPREAPGQMLPADPTDNPQCDGAARMVAAIKGLVNGYLGTASILEAINALMGIVLVLLPGYGVLVDLIIAAIGALVTIGTLAIIGAMTDEVYGTLTCILKAHVGDDGQITREELDAAFDDVETQIGGVAASVIGEFFNVLGVNGLNNASVLRDETGDCSDCPTEWCMTVDFTISDGGWTSIFGGTWTSGTGWTETCVLAGGNYYQNIENTLDLSTPAHITQMVLDFDYVAGDFNGIGYGAELLALGLNDTSYPTRVTVENNHTVDSPPSQQLILDTDSDFNNLFFQLLTSVEGSPVCNGSATALRMTLRGTGTAPTELEAVGWEVC